MDQHLFVCAAIGIDQRGKGCEGESRGDGDEDVGDAVGRPDEDLVFAPIHEGYAAILAKVVPDGNIRQGGRDAGEVDGGDGVRW